MLRAARPVNAAATAVARGAASSSASSSVAAASATSRAVTGAPRCVVVFMERASGTAAGTAAGASAAATTTSSLSSTAVARAAARSAATLRVAAPPSVRAVSSRRAAALPGVGVGVRVGGSRAGAAAASSSSLLLRRGGSAAAARRGLSAAEPGAAADGAAKEGASASSSGSSKRAAGGARRGAGGARRRARQMKPTSAAVESPGPFAQGVYLGVAASALGVGGVYLYDLWAWYKDMQTQGLVNVVMTYAMIGFTQWFEEHPAIREKLGSPPLSVDAGGLSMKVEPGLASITFPGAGPYSRAFFTIELRMEEPDIWVCTSVLVDCVDGTRLSLVDDLPEVLRVHDAQERLKLWMRHQAVQEAIQKGEPLPDFDVNDPTAEPPSAWQRFVKLFEGDDGTTVSETDTKDAKEVEIVDTARDSDLSQRATAQDTGSARL